MYLFHNNVVYAVFTLFVSGVVSSKHKAFSAISMALDRVLVPPMNPAECTNTQSGTPLSRLNASPRTPRLAAMHRSEHVCVRRARRTGEYMGE